MGCSQNIAKEVKKKQTKVQIVPGMFVVLNNKPFEDVYLLGRKLGSGSFGEVNFCTQKKTNSHRAVKIFKKADLRLEISKAKLKEEIEILKSLDHPNIVKIYEFFEDSDRFFIVMEHCKGGELFHDIMKSKKYSENDSALIMRQIFSGLVYLHEKGIVHRDLKPENILLDEKSELASIKIIDFGSAAFFTEDRMHDIVGTSYYMSPEMIHKRYTEKCDVWSAGVILYTLIVGEPPFTGRSTEEIIENIVNNTYSKAAVARANVTEDLKDFLSHLLAQEDKRFSARQAISHPWIRRQCFDEVDRETISKIFENLAINQSSNLLKSAVKTFICTQIMTIEQKKQLNLLFKALDEDGNGIISQEEVVKGLARLLPEREARIKTEKILQNSEMVLNGFITYTDFIRCAIDEEALFTKKNVSQAFEVFDKDGSGGISANELREVLCSNQEIDETIWSRIVKQIDNNGNGVIDKNEFESLFNI